MPEIHLFENNKTTLERRPIWYRLQGDDVIQRQTPRVPYVDRAYFDFISNNVQSITVQDLGDNYIEGEGAESIEFRTALLYITPVLELLPYRISVWHFDLSSNKSFE